MEEVHILWISEGLSCDGDSVSITAATLPSIEDVLLGNIPGLPKVHLHNKVLAYENGDEYMRAFYQAKNDELDAPFVLVIEGSIPNENISGEGFWTSLGFDHATGQPITLEPVDRLAGAEGVGRGRAPGPARPTAASTRWRATPRERWGWPTTWGGTSGRSRGPRS